MPHVSDPRQVIGTIVAVFIAITVHEFAHAKAAENAGDDTPRLAGRISLNPLDHLDILGTIMIIWMSLGGFGIGWGKPVPVNPARFRNPRRDSLKVSIAGIFANLILASLLAIPLRLNVFPPSEKLSYYWLLQQILFVNVAIAFFNLIPIPPLDGSHVLANLLPSNQSVAYQRLAGRYGFFILIALLISGSVGYIIGPPISFVIRILLGY